MRRIEKKIWPEYFEKILSGEKTYEFRLNDFDCETGDVLVLKEWNPKTGEYTGRKVEKAVGFVGYIDKFPAFWSKEEIEKYGFQIISLT